MKKLLVYISNKIPASAIPKERKFGAISSHVTGAASSSSVTFDGTTAFTGEASF